ncbi:MAG: hypothetical protein Q7W51_04365 [Coriobacteriia bacterium]|nr:hypothetical protein [Coriobacteriia bacterium]
MKRTGALIAALLLAAALAGCNGGGSSSGGSAENESSSPAAGDASAQVLVLGRSVMTGWMAHWGGDASMPAEWEGYTISMREIEGPPGIGESAASAIAEAPTGSTVLFKFCFVDFNGGDYTEELDAYLEYVAEVADAADSRGVRLILGTALPKVDGETTDELVAEHREFGQRIEEFAADRRSAGQDVVVLDLNAVLADSDGALRDRYAVSSDDSHLSDTAYDALDEALLPLLAERP